MSYKTQTIKDLKKALGKAKWIEERDNELILGNQMKESWGYINQGIVNGLLQAISIAEANNN